MERLRNKISIVISALIQALDELDRDREDREPDCEADDSELDNDEILEPSLGATEKIDQQLAWQSGAFEQDLELDFAE